MEPELIADTKCVIGEGPLWHPGERKLYWADIPSGLMFRYDPTTGEYEQCYEGDPVGGYTVQADGSLLFFMGRGAIRSWREGVLTTVIEEIPDERGTRFNDVIADPAGRVFCGTMPTEDRSGHLYRLDTDGTLAEILDDVGVSNGMGFTPDRKQMYYTDSTKRAIYLFDYDRCTGAITNQRVFVRTPDGEGVPDGMTVDAEGYVWSARWDGGALFRYNPDGILDRRIEFPANKVSSVIFGGLDYTDIYATTAGGDNRPKEGPGAGALFRINLGIQGQPEFLSRIGL